MSKKVDNGNSAVSNNFDTGFEDDKNQAFCWVFSQLKGTSRGRGERGFFF